MKKSSLASLWSIIFILSLSISAWGASFTVNFSDIELDNLKPGMPVSLLQKAAFPLTVTNTDNNSENMRLKSYCRKRAS